MSFDPKQMQFVDRNVRAQMRGAEALARARPGTFDEKVKRLEAWFDSVMEHPVSQAACVLIFFFAVVATAIGFFGLGAK